MGSIFVIHFNSVFSKRRKPYSRTKSKYSMPKTPAAEKTKALAYKGRYILFCALHLIHVMNMNEFCYFFVVDFWSFVPTELNTLSENEPGFRAVREFTHPRGIGTLGATRSVLSVMWGLKVVATP